MGKKLFILVLLSLSIALVNGQKHYDYPMPEYMPTEGNLEARKAFQDM